MMRTFNVAPWIGFRRSTAACGWTDLSTDVRGCQVDVMAFPANRDA